MNRLFEIVHGKNKNTKGFTLTELLIVVAILVVLCSLVVLSLVKMQKELRQKELDSKAEIIYVAAQNRITELKAQGMKAKYETNAVPLGFIPYDADKTLTSDEAEYYYASSSEKSDENLPAYWLLPLGSVDQELYSGNWIIEYNIKSGTVYSVFYSEEPITISALQLDYLRSKSARIDGGAKIGYYGGDITIIQATSEFEIRKLNIINGETLTAEITVWNPVSESFRLAYWLEDAAGNKTAEKEISAKTFIGGGEYTATLNLDSLVNSASRFHALFPELDAGSDFTLHVSAGIPTNPLIKRATREETANSLFAEREEGDSEDTAYIRLGRHLQNLDKDSGVFAGITKAVQKCDIFFAENGENENTGKLWLDVYGTKKLTAIDNPNLMEYSGTEENPEAVPTIFGANIAPNSGAEAAAGIFAKAYGGMTIKNVGLSGTTVASGKYSGALVGKAEGTISIEGCFAILSGEKGDLDGKMKTDVALLESRISGTDSAGGLIGFAANGAVIKNSYAATLVRGGNSSSVGGLCGASGGTLSVSESYADCYLFGSAVGGISGNAATLSIQDSYAAGYISATGTAYGISGGALSGSSARTYTAVHTTNDKPFYSTSSSGSAPVYYLEEGSDEAHDLSGTVRKSFTEMSDLPTFVTLLGNKFTTSTGGSNSAPYNLLAQGLVDYSYPKLAALPHYGDWNAEFVTAQLVYFEEYSNGFFGFSGANKDCLREAGSSTYAVGDGYALVFDSGTKPSAGSEITFSIQLSSAGGMSQKYRIDSAESDFKTVTDEDGEVYYLLPIRSGDVDPVNMGYTVTDSFAPSAFYRSIVIENAGNADTYYFNPHFAKTVTSELPARAPGYVYIRSPRQLYWMSMEYEDYADFLEGGTTTAIFRQETALHYDEYKWDDYFPTDKNNFSGGKLISQRPIGTAAEPFTGIYDGSCCSISGVSFATNENYVGLFGVSTGRISNTVLTKSGINSSAETQTLRRTGTIIHSGTNVYMGVLCGINRGTIYNCAVANYTAVVDVNQGAVLSLGGLCGENAGIISNSSAVISNFEVSSLYSTIYAGGFAGTNHGTIRYCYALGSITVKSANSTRPVKIAGFTAESTGEINYSYCATALATSGSAVSSAFSPSDYGSTPKNSYYINDGTYYFTDSLYAYKFGDDYGALGPQPVKAEQLKKTSISRYFGKVRNCSYDKYGTFYPGETDYPFPAIVKDASGNFIHYGDWVVEANLGEVGVFYWEYEEGSGSNGGYHLSFNGIEGNGVVSGSTLCNVHDDDGIITSYGYGYYYKTGTGEPVLTIDGMASSRYTRNSDAEAGLNTILPEFTFVAYTSGTPQSASSNPEGVLFIEGTKANSEWLLTPAGGGNPVTHTFYVCPFFADALSYDSSSGADVPEDEATAGRNDNYRKTPGTDENKYQIRSAEQLQYINWNNSTKSVSTAVSSSNYTRFTYLQYATNTNTSGSTYQTFANATRNRPVQFWDQTHDIDNKNESFSPIAGTYVTSSGSYVSVLYAWFGGSYNGESYVIRNIHIDSNLCNVGLFGTTVAASLENIILYSDMDSEIVRSTEIGDPAGAYVVGGLVGIAYDYVRDASVYGKNEIKNCSIAGYKIIDNSKNTQGLGETNVGGLVGITGVNLNSCTAVVDIEINCTHRTAAGGYTSAQWGNFIRVGGIAGACRYNMLNCYSGGTISVSEDTLSENVSDAGTLTTGLFAKFKSTHVYIGGLGGSGFCSNFYNFSASSAFQDGTPQYTNCYTYMTFPKLEGTVRSISLIGGVADRYGNGAKSIIRNCYYLDSSANIQVDLTSKLRGSGGETNSIPSIFTRFSGAETAMLNGNMNYIGVNVVGYQTGNTLSTLNGLTALTYDQMSERDMLPAGSKITPENSTDTTTYNTFAEALGSAYSWVTVTENGAAVNGKYSFAGSDLALEGKNYPFPTVLTQKSLVDGSTVNVHYGAWTKVGLFWSESMNYMDVFRDYDEETQEATKDIALTFEGLEIENPDVAKFTLNYYQDNSSYLEGNPQEFETTEDIPVVVTIADEDGDGIFEAELKAQNTGACYVRATYNDNGATYTADCYVSVTADFTVTADPAFASVYVGDKDKKIELSIASKNADGTEKNLIGFFESWEIENDKSESSLIFYDGEQPVKGDEKFDFTYEGTNEGDLRLSIKANVKITLCGTERIFSNTAYVSVSVKKAGRIGISVPLAEETTGYYEAALPRDEETATGVTYLSAAANYSEAPNKPALEGEAVFVYANGTGVDIENFSLTKIEVLKEGILDATVYNNGATDYSKYYVEIGEKKAEEADPFFDYRTIRINGTESGAVELRATFTYYGDTYVVTAPVTITAAEPKAILVDAEGRSLLEKTVAYGAVPALTAEDWAFADAAANTAEADLGYHCDRAAGTVPTFGKIYVDTKYSVTLLPNSYTVKFDKAAAEATGTAADIPAVYDSSFVLPGTVYERLGYKLSGWSLEAGGSFNLSQSVSNLTSENGGTVTLSAIWTEVPDYKVEFSLNGGSGDVPAIIEEIKYGEAKSLPDGTGISKTGYEFLGWAATQTAAEPMGNSAKNLTDKGGTVTLHAVWAKKSYNLTYIFDNGTANLIENHLFEETINLPSPTKTGHDFTGWYLGETLVESLSMPAGNTTLTAHWTIKQYTVSFNANGGTPETLTPVTQNYGTAVSLPTVTREGYNFLGWSDGTTTYTAYTVPAGDITLTAQWREIPYRVTFNANGGSISSSYTKDYYYGDTIDLPVPTWRRQTFSYWTTDGTNSYNAGTQYTVTGEATLYAKWDAYKLWFTVRDGAIVSAGNITGTTINHNLNTTSYSVHVGSPDGATMPSNYISSSNKDRIVLTRNAYNNDLTDNVYFVVD